MTEAFLGFYVGVAVASLGLLLYLRRNPFPEMLRSLKRMVEPFRRHIHWTDEKQMTTVYAYHRCRCGYRKTTKHGFGYAGLARGWPKPGTGWHRPPCPEGHQPYRGNECPECERLYGPDPVKDEPKWDVYEPPAPKRPMIDLDGPCRGKPPTPPKGPGGGSKINFASFAEQIDREECTVCNSALMPCDCLDDIRAGWAI